MSNGFNNWQAMADALIPACRDAAVNTAQAAQNNIQDVIKANGQIKTGRMYSSVYNVSDEGSNYPSTSDPLLLPEVAKPEKETDAVVAAGASYSVFQDKGTVHMAGKPFFDQGMDNTRQDLDKAMEGVAKKLEDAARQ